MEVINKKILIVEDDKDFLWILRQSFGSKGFDVIYALDGEEGLAMAEKEKPDLILSDILMPKMDGIEMAKKLQEKKISSKIVFLTNVKDAGRLSEAMETISEIDYIVKSDLHIDAIIERVRRKLGLK
jgi:DNA-binding response OmpR family regulator